jgi:hypothetical protein
MNSECRVCGAPIAVEETDDPADAAERETADRPAEQEEASPRPVHASRPRFAINIRWVASGAVILALLVGGGEMWAESRLKADTMAWSVVNDALVKAERGQELSAPEKERVREALIGNSWMVPLLIVMFLIFPVGLGVLVGYATGSVRDGIIAVAGGMAGYIVFIAHYLPLVIVAVPLYSGIGAVAALLGRRLAKRARE